MLHIVQHRARVGVDFVEVNPHGTHAADGGSNLHTHKVPAVQAVEFFAFALPGDCEHQVPQTVLGQLDHSHAVADLGLSEGHTASKRFGVVFLIVQFEGNTTHGGLGHVANDVSGQSRHVVLEPGQHSNHFGVHGIEFQPAGQEATQRVNDVLPVRVHIGPLQTRGNVRNAADDALQVGLLAGLVDARDPHVLLDVVRFFVQLGGDFTLVAHIHQTRLVGDRLQGFEGLGGLAQPHPCHLRDVFSNHHRQQAQIAVDALHGLCRLASSLLQHCNAFRERNHLRLRGGLLALRQVHCVLQFVQFLVQFGVLNFPRVHRGHLGGHGQTPRGPQLCLLNLNNLLIHLALVPFDLVLHVGHFRKCMLEIGHIFLDGVIQFLVAHEVRLETHFFVV